MAKIVQSVFTDKNVMSQKAKAFIRNNEMDLLKEAFEANGYEATERLGVVSKEWTDGDGKTFYSVFEFKTTSLHPDEASKPRAKIKEAIDFTIEG